MAYQIVIRVDNDDEADSAPLKAAWLLDQCDTEAEAISLAMSIRDAHCDDDGYCLECDSYGNVHDPAKHGVGPA